MVSASFLYLTDTTNGHILIKEYIFTSLSYAGFSRTH
jgi:hypothetical protein